MLSITLPPALQDALTQSARAQGTTPELLAVESLQRLFAPAPPPEHTDSLPEHAEPQTLYDFLEGYIGVIDSSETVPGGAQMSTDPGRKFAEGMVKKREQGKL